MAENYPQIEGFHLNSSPQGPVLPVVERIRAVYQSGGTFSVEREEVCAIQAHRVYRVQLLVNDQCFIGDADLSPQSDRTRSPSQFDAQVAAVGQALDFAGFGDPRTVFARLGRNVDPSLLEPAGECAPARRVIAGITTMLLDGVPYVAVRERLFQVHQSGLSFSMIHGEISELAGKWISRISIQVGGQRFSGDAEIFWQAPAGTPDATHPVAHAQLVAVGNALALAGFGDVRGILQRQGKDIPSLAEAPQLASVELAQRVHQQHPPRQPTERATEPAPVLLPEQQRQQVEALCERLGRSAPDWSQVSATQARELLASLRAEEADLLHTADAARHPCAAQGHTGETDSPVDAAQVRELRQRWRTVTHPTGDIFAAWKDFKVSVLGGEVSDAALRSGQYSQLVQALDRLALPAAPPASPTVSHSLSTPIRQAPRLANSSSNR